MNRLARLASVLLGLVVACAPAPVAPVGAPSLSLAPDSNAVANLVAFTTLLGDIRFFHPSDQAANADWEKFAIDAIPRVEGARSPAELARALREVFAPVAPTARIYVAGHPESLSPSLLAPPDPSAPTYVGWVHYGVKLDDPQPIYARVRASNRVTPRSAPSEVQTWITASAARGHPVHVHASARAELSDPNASAIVVLEAWIPHVGIRDVASAPVTSASWTEIDITGDVPNVDRMQVHFGLRLTGAGKAWLDDVTASVGDSPLPIDDADFEHAIPGELPAGWFNDDQTATANAVRPHGGKLCAQIDAPPLPIEPLPTPAQTFHVALGAGVEADVPLALYVDSAGRTLPIGKPAPPPTEAREARLARYSANERAVRLADVALAWGVLEHFYPYFDVVPTDWLAELRRALARAESDTDTASFHLTLKRLIAALHDGHGYVSAEQARVPALAGMPIRMRVVEGKLAVVAVAPGSNDVRVGDVVEEIGGVSASRALARRGELISAATPQFLALREALDVDFGPKDEVVELSLRRPDGRAYAARLRRTEDVNVGRTRTKPDKIAEVAPGVLYVDLDRITDDDFTAALPRLTAARGVIFDLRGYPKNVSVDPLRHLAREPLHCPQFFTLKTEKPDREGVQLVDAGCTLAPLAPRISAASVFLVDAQAMSYAETYLGIVVGHHLATLVGETSAGTNGNANSFLLPGGYRVGFTGTKALKGDGSRHHGIGFAPKVACAPTIAGISAGVDEVLACGVKVIDAAR
ncbi:MAG TPA: S41 family peptidase [Polyangiaceae bacterium]